MTILDGIESKKEKDSILAAAMDPTTLKYCEQLKSQGIDFEIVRISKTSLLHPPGDGIE